MDELKKALISKTKRRKHNFRGTTLN